MAEEKQARHETKDKFVLRFDDQDQRAKLKSRAALNRRSLNEEILFLIDRGIDAIDGKAQEK